MTIDWCPGIREACGHWRDAPMLQQTFDAMERNLEQNNDACIDCAKTVVEVVCRVVVESFHTQQAPLKPTQETPSLSDWLTAAIRALKLGDVRDDRFKKLVSSHHKLADALNDLRNKAGPASHGKDPYLARLAEHHRQGRPWKFAAINLLSVGVNIGLSLFFLLYCMKRHNMGQSNALIDAHVGLAVDAEDGDSPTLRFLLPGGDELPINIEVSRLLYQLDRGAYVEALNAARGAPAPAVEPIEEQGEP